MKANQAVKVFGWYLTFLRMVSILAIGSCMVALGLGIYHFHLAVTTAIKLNLYTLSVLGLILIVALLAWFNNKKQIKKYKAKRQEAMRELGQVNTNIGV